MHHKMNVNQ